VQVHGIRITAEGGQSLLLPVGAVPQELAKALPNSAGSTSTRGPRHPRVCALGSDNAKLHEDAQQTQPHGDGGHDGTCRHTSMPERHPSVSHKQGGSEGEG